MWTVGWVYPIIGIPLAAPPEDSTLGVVQCEAGSQLEKKIDLLLTGCLPGNRDLSGRDGAFSFFLLFLMSFNPSGDPAASASTIQTLIKSFIQMAASVTVMMMVMMMSVTKV